MTTYCYRLTLHLASKPDVHRPEVIKGIENARERIAKRLVATFAGDPLPNQQVPFSIPQSSTAPIIVQWRLQIPSDRNDLRSEVKKFVADLPDGLFPVTSWELRAHVCRNGHHQRCTPWETILSSNTKVMR